MAEELLLLADNVFSTRLYPEHTVSANEEASGYEAYHVATWRRHASDAWRATTANNDSYVQVRCNVPRAVNCLVIDRNSNHLGERFTLKGSNDNFATSTTILDVTVPLVSGGLPSGAYGCVTLEGAWIVTFDAETFYDYRLTSVAMGANITVSLGGVWLGLAWMPTGTISYPPRDDLSFALTMAETVSPFGWAGRSYPVRGRIATLTFKAIGDAEDDAIGQNLLEMGSIVPLWVMQRRASAPERAFLARLTSQELRHDDNLAAWFPGRTMTVSVVEEQPAVR